MTLKIHALISSKVSKNTWLTSQELKEKNPQLLEDVSLRSVQQLLHDDLGYKNYKTNKNCF